MKSSQKVRFNLFCKTGFFSSTFLLFIALLILCCGNNSGQVFVKYRDTPIDLNNGKFEKIDTSKSSFVKGAWYNSEQKYFVIKLNDTYYHYCRMPVDDWKSFKQAESFGKHYNQFIRGNFDCRLGGVPAD